MESEDLGITKTAGVDSLRFEQEADQPPAQQKDSRHGQREFVEDLDDKRLVKKL